MKSLIELIPLDLPVSFTDKLKEDIIARMKALAVDKDEHRLCLKILLWVCCCIESSIEKGLKTNKKQIVVEIYKKVYGLSVEEEVLLKNNIDMLWTCKRIKKKSYWKLFIANFRESISL